MSGTSLLQVDARELERVTHALAGTSLKIKENVLIGVGAEIESQVRKRIDEDKTAPDGTDWEVWSESYRKTRRGQHSLLVGHGELLDSIQHAVTGGSVDVGTNLIYAPTHQYGDPERNIPERPFLGLSSDDTYDIMDLVDDIVGGAMP